jgi:hypothetical protein
MRLWRNPSLCLLCQRAWRSRFGLHKPYKPIMESSVGYGQNWTTVGTFVLFLQELTHTMRSNETEMRYLVQRRGNLSHGRTGNSTGRYHVCGYESVYLNRILLFIALKRDRNLPHFARIMKGCWGKYLDRREMKLREIGKKLHNKELNNLYSSPSIIKVI